MEEVARDVLPAVDAARLRFRPILMTSFAFLLGVVPLVTAGGAGAASRRALGTAAFGRHGRGHLPGHLLRADALPCHPAPRRRPCLSRGVATGLDVRQAEQLQLAVDGQIAGLERAIAQTENGLRVLLAAPPGEIARGQVSSTLPLPPAVPAGLPSSLLERRPAIRQAEQQLVAANADVGVARAQFGRRRRPVLPHPVRRSRRSSTPAATAPRCAWRNRCSASWSCAMSSRSRQALREVSDALIAYRTTVSQRDTQDRLVASLREASRLTLQRYQGGLDSYLQVLDAQRTLFQSELRLATLQQQTLGAVVALYRALGGGWTDAPMPTRSPPSAARRLRRPARGAGRATPGPVEGWIRGARGV